MALPKVIYVYEDTTDTETYLVASTDSHEQMAGLVGVYELCEMLHVRHKPQFRRAKSKIWFDKG